jgi:peptidoglycan hydrolase CwlO-like protein
MSEELEQVVAEKDMQIQALVAEVNRVRQIATDRLVYLRILEKGVNDINSLIKATTADITEVSNSVVERNASLMPEVSDLRPVLEEDNTEEE